MQVFFNLQDTVFSEAFSESNMMFERHVFSCPSQEPTVHLVPSLELSEHVSLCESLTPSSTLQHMINYYLLFTLSFPWGSQNYFKYFRNSLLHNSIFQRRGHALSQVPLKEVSDMSSCLFFALYLIFYRAATIFSWLSSVV